MSVHVAYCINLWSPGNNKTKQMNSTEEQQLEAQTSEQEPKTIYTIRNIVIVGITIIFVIGVSILSYFEYIKKNDQGGVVRKDNSKFANVYTNPKEFYAFRSVDFEEKTDEMSNLSEAIAKNDTDLAISFLEHSITVRHLEEYYRQALLYAIKNGNKDVVNKLFGKASYHELKGIVGFALKSNQFEIAKSLIYT